MKLKIVSLIYVLGNPIFAQAAPSIIHGTTVTPSERIAKTVVALVASNQQGQALCTASIVASDLALTAAHCVSPNTMMNLIFSTDIHHAGVSQLRSVDRVEIPAEWRVNGSMPKDTSDLALLHFSGGLPTGYVTTDLLPENMVLSSGQTVELAGYGISDASADSGAGLLRKVEVSVLNPDFSPSEVELDQSHGGGACHGDSGGPAYVIINNHPYLFGVTSRGGGNCDRDVIYTKMSAYWDWLAEASTRLRSN